MEEKTKRELEELIGQIKCPKDFVCYKSGLKELCKAVDIGMKSYLKCLDYAESHYCTCPLRRHIAKKEGK